MLLEKFEQWRMYVFPYNPTDKQLIESRNLLRLLLTKLSEKSPVISKPSGIGNEPVASGLYLVRNKNNKIDLVSYSNNEWKLLAEDISDE